MDVLDYDTEHSLSAANAAAESSKSNDVLDELSLASQRRLIRKPLPEAPFDRSDGVIGGQSYILGRSPSPRRKRVDLQQSSQRAKERALEEKKDLDWWPEIPSDCTSDVMKQDTLAALKLNVVYRKHLSSIVECSLDRADDGIATAILSALEACLESLGQPDTLQALQRSFSLLWRIEALIRSNEHLEDSKSDTDSTRWPRLSAWRSAASSTSTHSTIEKDVISGTNTDVRKRKRDVALQLLSNAFWIAGSGSNGVVPAKHDYEEADVATSSLNKTFPRRPAPQLLVKSGIPTVALQTAEVVDDSSKVARANSDHSEAISDRSSVLTSRLAMQLKNSEGSVRSTQGSRQRSMKAEEDGRMAICRICVDFVEEGDALSSEGSDFRRQRSGTITLTLHKRQQNLSEASTRSNRTLRESDRREKGTPIRIRWKPNQYQGSVLSLNPLCSKSEEGDEFDDTSDARLQRIGGSFLVEAQELTVQEQENVREALNIGLYSACAMLLEEALLRDLGVDTRVEAVAEKNEIAVIATPNSPQASELQANEAVLASIPHPAEDKTLPSRWPKSIWGILHYPADHMALPLKDSNGSFSRSRKSYSHSKKSASRALLGYSGRLGRVIGSFAGSSGQFAATDNDVASIVDPEEAKLAESVKKEATVESEVQEADVQICPQNVSPYYTAQIESVSVKKDDDDYIDTLMAGQSISLNVIEGMDTSLALSKQSQHKSTPRASLHSRRSCNGTDNTTSSTDSSFSGTVSSISASSMKARQSIGDRLTKQDDLSPTTATQQEGESTRRSLQYYQRAGPTKDVSLGQALEEMAAKAQMLYQKSAATTTASKRNEADADETEGHQRKRQVYRIAQYLHGHDRISIVASIDSADMLKEDSSVVANEKGDVAAVAKASRLSHDVVRSAIFLAEHLGESSPTEAAEKDSKRILLWSTESDAEEKPTMRILSRASYLYSYAAFIKDVLSHPKLAAKRHQLIRFFKVGKVLLKLQVQPIVVFDLLSEGPVVVTKDEASKSTLDGESTNIDGDDVKADKKMVDRTRMEIRDFYASIKRYISNLEHILVARDLDERGQTIKISSRNRKSIASTVSGEEDSFDESLMNNIGSSLSSAEPLSLLSRLKKVFRTAEFELYDALKSTKGSHINDVRYEFHRSAKSARKRLSQWEIKHLASKEMKELQPLDYLEPEYFAKGVYAFPGSVYLVREAEPLSIVAYCLSSRDYAEEVKGDSKSYADLNEWRRGIRASSRGHSVGASSTSTTTNDTSTAERSAVSLQEEDEDHLSEDWPTVNMKRKKRVKDANILSLTLKRVSSNIGSNSASEATEGGTRATVNSQIAESYEDNDGVKTPTAPKITSLHFDTVSSVATGSETFLAQIVPLMPRTSLGSMFEGQSTTASTPAIEIDAPRFPESMADHQQLEAKTDGIERSKSPHLAADTITPTASLKSNGTKVASSPHIKHSVTLGNLKVSCISWFAEDFAALRRKWDINTDFIQSMSRCKSCHVVGGKSKSSFFLSLDGKWIAKQLLNVWSVDEKEAFLEFAPAYLRYMMNSVVDDCPTLLVKIAGVYTLKMKDVKTGEVKLKMSVQVLENVFSGDREDSIRFDIKGIKDRKVTGKKDSRDGVDEEGRAPVWWDAEFLECFQSRAFVPERQKQHFMRALRNDLAFLTASNIIDYSLLIGAYEGLNQEASSNKDEEKGGKNKLGPAFCVRIVDFLGAFTLYKFIESSSKKAIRSQAPTVIPPLDYATRFARSVETYFISCPE